MLHLHVTLVSPRSIQHHLVKLVFFPELIHCLSSRCVISIKIRASLILVETLLMTTSPSLETKLLQTPCQISHSTLTLILETLILLLLITCAHLHDIRHYISLSFPLAPDQQVLTQETPSNELALLTYVLQ